MHVEETSAPKVAKPQKMPGNFTAILYFQVVTNIKKKKKKSTWLGLIKNVRSRIKCTKRSLKSTRKVTESTEFTPFFLL